VPGAVDDLDVTFDDLLERFARWAQRTENVRAAMVIGSRARADHPADEWSDLDLLVFAVDPAPIVGSTDWLAEIAQVWLTFAEPAGGGGSPNWERRVLFGGGLDVDIAVVPAPRIDAPLDDPPADFVDIVRRGVRVIADKDGVLAAFLSRPLPERVPPARPTADEFVALASNFWFHALWTARHLRRGELWWAMGALDGLLKQHLGRMLEWHTRATRGDEVDTWLRGRFLEEWADPRAVAELSGAFARNDTGDMARALNATMALFRWLEDETAEHWGFQPPIEGERGAADLAGRLTTGAPASAG
jgi:aminoglycoside 6-adenylyltransferase